MKHQRHFDPSDAALREVARTSELIGDLDRIAQILDCDIAAEEERAGVSNPLDGNYPFLARTQAARRENIKRTIAALRKRLASRPDEVELVRYMRIADNT
jgi:hypothetical protein